ncbi:hypothetical protein CCMSSC00406_0009897 [Pleurotus cornucopiae]|uniref:Uncharacterized protein n=1 Tax=Pleurotus cornucopiae TaxID=5321 RepID=A0ACB7IK84_PLECO|nr:hypothetical protein CCMSSC00406_0009897 [Pleurotus cornucopiae]
MSGSSSALGEAAFAALPKTLQAEIDNAFTSISLSNPPHRQSHSETHSSLTPAALGGGGGGFILEDPVAETDAQGDTTSSARVPLASIPAALALLDLPPHDRQILAVFRDAAESDDDDSDDTAEYGANGANNGKEASVSRSQWRAVCAVLLEGSSDPSPSPSSHSSPSSHHSPASATRQREERKTHPRRSKAAYTPISASNDASESGDDSDPYVASDDSDHSLQRDKDQYDDDDDDDDDDEYTSKPSKSPKNSKSPSKANANANAPPDSAAALDAFALFFPSTPHDPTPRASNELKDNSNELKDKNITLRDLQAAMKRAGERYKADDVRASCLPPSLLPFFSSLLFFPPYLPPSLPSS